MGYPAAGYHGSRATVAAVLDDADTHQRDYSQSEYPCIFYRSAGGAEIDLVLEKGGKRIAIEIKVSQTPRLTQGFYAAMEVVRPSEAYVIAPVAEPYHIYDNVAVHSHASMWAV